MYRELLQRCNHRYSNRIRCEDCESEGYCPQDCGICLERIHYPSRNPKNAPKRKYDCTNMVDYYVCKYSNKYMSELMYAYLQLDGIRDLNRLYMLSFGCGPCTDLLAIQHLNELRELNNEHIIYYGIEYCCDVWRNIHEDIMDIAPHNYEINIGQLNNCSSIDLIGNLDEFPNLITFQYVLSDMTKNTGAAATREFIRDFADLINERMEVNSYIVINDVALTVSHGGGIDYYDYLASKLDNCIIQRKYFDNNNPGRTGYRYGKCYQENELLIPIMFGRDYQPYLSCSSTQMIISKVA